MIKINNVAELVRILYSGKKPFLIGIIDEGDYVPESRSNWEIGRKDRNIFVRF